MHTRRRYKRRAGACDLALCVRARARNAYTHRAACRRPAVQYSSSTVQATGHERARERGWVQRVAGVCARTTRAPP